jgi:hypothetical protein
MVLMANLEELMVTPEYRVVRTLLKPHRVPTKYQMKEAAL